MLYKELVCMENTTILSFGTLIQMRNFRISENFLLF